QFGHAGRPQPPGGIHQRNEVTDEPDGEQDGDTQQPRPHRRTSGSRSGGAVVGHMLPSEVSTIVTGPGATSSTTAHFLCRPFGPAVSLNLPAPSRVEISLWR